MTRTSGTQWVAECFWPGVTDHDVLDVDRRVVDALADAAQSGDPVDYFGSLRITDDDVVLFHFEGSIGSVQKVTELAGIRATRILHCTRTTVRSGDDPSSTRSHS